MWSCVHQGRGLGHRRSLCRPCCLSGLLSCSGQEQSRPAEERTASQEEAERLLEIGLLFLSGSLFWPLIRTITLLAPRWEMPWNSGLNSAFGGQGGVAFTWRLHTGLSSPCKPTPLNSLLPPGNSEQIISSFLRSDPSYLTPSSCPWSGPPALMSGLIVLPKWLLVSLLSVCCQSPIRNNEV